MGFLTRPLPSLTSPLQTSERVTKSLWCLYAVSLGGRLGMGASNIETGFIMPMIFNDTLCYSTSHTQGILAEVLVG
jgi:hypothetical protein